MNLDLRLQHDALDGFIRRLVCHFEFEMEERRDAVVRCLHVQDFEIEIRHQLSFNRLKNPSISRQTSSPPDSPRQ